MTNTSLAVASGLHWNPPAITGGYSNVTITMSGAVALLCSDDVPLRPVVSQGCRPIGKPLTITRAERNLAHELAGRPAMERLQEIVQAATDADRNLMREGRVSSGAFLSVDPQQSDRLYHLLKGTPRVAGVTVKEMAYRSFQETLAQNILLVRVFNVTFATVIAFGVVYNTARISLSERSRELATLRVIGFSRAEISFILLGELAVLTLAALPVGLLIGYALAAVSAAGMDTDLVILEVGQDDLEMHRPGTIQKLLRL